MLDHVEKGKTMSEKIESYRLRVGIAIGLAAMLALAAPAWSHGDEEHAEAAPGATTEQAAPAGKVAANETRHAGPRLAMPMMNPARGRELFVAKGCFACHSINGVGGHDATALDAHSMDHVMNPFDFAAKMWRGAPAMIAAQEGAFNSQIMFNGQELANIIAFVHDHRAQHLFTEADLTLKAMKMMDHDHGAMSGAEVHAPELGHKTQSRKPGHTDAPGAPPHKH